MSREDRKEELRHQLTVEKAANGTLIVTLGQAVVGRLQQDSDTGRWQLERKERWGAMPTQLENDQVEQAETWAVDEIADMLAMEREACDRVKG